MNRIDPLALDAASDPALHDLATRTTLAEVVELLDISRVDNPDGHRGADIAFTAEHTALAATSGHVFGGLVAAQAVVAACRTVSADAERPRPIHSLHAYFLRRGDPSVPLELLVEQTRDGRAFSHRRVSVRQHGRAIMEMACSFAVPEPGLRHQAPMPDVPEPEDLLPDWQLLQGLPDVHVSATAPGPFDIRTAGTHSRLARDLGEGTDRTRQWLRADTGSELRLPDDPVLHTGLFVYSSDLMVLDPTTRPHALSMLANDVAPTTIDHALWFHASLRADEWFLFNVDSPWSGDGRGFARGLVFDQSGTVVAEVAQEALIRPTSRPSSRS